MTNTIINYIIITVGNSFDKARLFEQIRTRKIFVKSDVLVYALLLVTVVALFLFLIVFQPSSSNGFKVEIDGQTVLTHEYGKSFEIKEQFGDLITVTGEGENYTVKIFSDGGYNIIFVDEAKKSVKMQESDCPSNNCVYMQAISSAGAIYCAPREIKITPLSDNELNLNPTLFVGGQG